MQRQKSKSKDPQINILSQVLAQFDIETQVNKMAIKSFQALLRGNRQAFQFINDSERKFIQFQERLSKAQNYYKNIELSVNAKIEVTSNLNTRLEQFSVQYWNSMREHTNQIIEMNKRNDQFNEQLRKHLQRIELNQKEILRFNTMTDVMKDHLNKQVQQLSNYQNQKYSQLKDQMRHDRQRIQNFVSNLHEAKALLESKSSLLTELLQDIALYKEERPMYQNQIKELFDELGNRTTKVQMGQLRVYVDNKDLEQKQRVDQLVMRIDTRIKLEQRDRIRADQVIKESISVLSQQNNTKHEKLNLQIQTNIKQIHQLIATVQNQMNQKIRNNEQKISQVDQKLTKQLPILQSIIKANSASIEIIQKEQKSQKAQVEQATSNVGSLVSTIDSFNQTIVNIVKENEARKQEMSKLKMNSQSQSSISQQLQTIMDKLNINQKAINEIKAEIKDYIYEKINKNHQMLIEKSELLSLKCNSIEKQMQASQSTLLYSIEATNTNILNSITEMNKSLKQKIDQNDFKQTQYTNQQIQGIRDKLQSLKEIHGQIKQFKQIFKNQIQQNDKVNVSIQEKMERLMGMFTKLKSDSSVRFQSISAEQQRRTIQIKNSLKEVEDIKHFASVVNETLSIILGVEIWNQQVDRTQNLKQSTIKQGFKISSILEGWVLEIDEKDRAKYRGQNLPKKKLLQMAFEFFVKYGDKIKGSIIQNGKDVFSRMMESNQQVFQQHKRTISKRKGSQLPKLHL